MPANAQGKDYLTRLFAKDLAENLYPDNSFYMQSMDDSDFVQGDEVVLPHAGTAPGVKKNREGKGEASKRQDTHSKYDMHEFTTDPTWLQYSEELLAHYNKRASIMFNHKEALNTAIADFIAVEWAKGDLTNPTRTSGAARPTSVGTGVRNAFTLDDLLTIQARMNKDEIPQEGRFALITSDMLTDMLKWSEVKSSDFNNGKALVSGSVGHYLGFDFFIRSSVNRFTAGGTTIREAGGTLADTDCAGALFWHKGFVRKAKGSTVVFLEKGKAEYYGDLMSCLTRSGAKYARKDGKGVYNLIEGVPQP